MSYGEGKQREGRGILAEDVCNRVIEERLGEGLEGGSKLCGHLTKNFPGRENNKCKGSEAGGCLGMLEKQ